MVRVKVMVFASVREEIGRAEFEMSLPSGAKAGDVLAHLEEDFKHLAPVLEKCWMAVNGEYATAEAGLHEGDEVAVLPPISGG